MLCPGEVGDGGGRNAEPTLIVNDLSDGVLLGVDFEVWPAGFYMCRGCVDSSGFIEVFNVGLLGPVVTEYGELFLEDILQEDQSNQNVFILDGKPDLPFKAKEYTIVDVFFI